ncbi:hypothetical protein SAMN06269185_2137 [Natronoarchaeum philippinense]|uniref:Uncharacterized protein n=1 Tax=Natronoarchaeum philippinense TaxID=558529 RepID=A0A285P0E8_NATPI|nr:hypothetical protein [Natronoarchaeum philippinense]SNZ13361.1 hypothetical protein SAMN06269185_2137 [Natronoarchaeum philippinense]
MTDHEPNEYVIEQVEREGESLLVGEFLQYIERYDDDAERGVSDELLDAYVETLREEDFFVRGPSKPREQIDERTTDSETWVEQDAFYEVGDGHVSNFPEHWHDQLGGEDDLRAFVRVMTEDIESAEEGTDRGGQGTGVPEPLLLDAAAIIGAFSREEATAKLEAARDRGELVMDADMNRQGRVKLPE